MLELEAKDRNGKRAEPLAPKSRKLRAPPMRGRRVIQRQAAIARSPAANAACGSARATAMPACASAWR